MIINISLMIYQSVFVFLFELVLCIYFLLGIHKAFVEILYFPLNSPHIYKCSIICNIKCVICIIVYITLLLFDVRIVYGNEIVESVQYN